MIDSHCHLTAEQFVDDVPAVLKRANQAGVQKIITIAEDLVDATACIRLANNYEQIFCTVGVHPHRAHTWQADSSTQLHSLCTSHEKVCAIGEIGLDYHYEFSPKDLQITALQAQIEVANSLDLPVVIHNRESWQDLWELIQHSRPKKAVLHCCTEPLDIVKLWLKAGYIISFTGICTYKSAAEMTNVIAYCPLEQMMIETDAPFLAPVPYRGKRNEPAYIIETAKCIARIKQISVEEVLKVTTGTCQEFFALP